jgi:hypothetical protein
LDAIAAKEAPMYNPHTLLAEQMARERTEQILAAARVEHMLREAEGSKAGGWAQFNHYHYWPSAAAQQRLAALDDTARVERLIRRRPGLLERLAAAFARLFRRASAA